jgi:hypothetical protein
MAGPAGWSPPSWHALLLLLHLQPAATSEGHPPPCFAGEKLNAGSEMCGPCEKGTYQSRPEHYEYWCTPCGASSYTPEAVHPGHPYERCGGGTCTAAVLGTAAGGGTCASHIEWLTSGNYGGEPWGETQACKQIAYEHPAECGACMPKCGTHNCTPTVLATEACFNGDPDCGATCGSRM